MLLTLIVHTKSASTTVDASPEGSSDLSMIPPAQGLSPSLADAACSRLQEGPFRSSGGRSTFSSSSRRYLKLDPAAVGVNRRSVEMDGSLSLGKPCSLLGGPSSGGSAKFRVSRSAGLAVAACILGALAVVSCVSASALTESELKELVQVESSVPVEVLERRARIGEIVEFGDFESKSLSVVLAFAVGTPKEDFRPLTDANAVAVTDPWILIERQSVTLLPSHSIFDVSIVHHSEGVASGRFRFRREGMFEGFADFKAQRLDGRWSMVHFSLPLAGWSCSKGSDGRWTTNIEPP